MSHLKQRNCVKYVLPFEGLIITFRYSLEDTSCIMILIFFQNWLYKIASVREVVPRFYLETALLKCYKFSCDRSGFSAILERLTIMIRVNIIYLVIIILYNAELLSRTICSLNVLCSAKSSIKKSQFTHFRDLVNLLVQHMHVCTSFILQNKVMFMA